MLSNGTFSTKECLIIECQTLSFGGIEIRGNIRFELFVNGECVKGHRKKSKS